jgi:hypothetical protein
MDREIKMVFAVGVALVVLAMAGEVWSAKIESDTYNRITGAHTTWWDAYGVKLLVVGVPK